VTSPKPGASAGSATGAHLFFQQHCAVKIKVFNCYTKVSLPKSGASASSTTGAFL